MDLLSVCVLEDLLFIYMGVDFVGFFFIWGNFIESDNDNCYVCLFICVFKRVVYFELIWSFNVEFFLLVFCWFISCCGFLVILMFDNGKMFKGLLKEIVKIVWLKEDMCYFFINGVSWKFIVEKVLWWGGFWECLM